MGSLDACKHSFYDMDSYGKERGARDHRNVPQWVTGKSPWRHSVNIMLSKFKLQTMTDGLLLLLVTSQMETPFTRDGIYPRFSVIAMTLQSLHLVTLLHSRCRRAFVAGDHHHRDHTPREVSGDFIFSPHSFRGREESLLSVDMFITRFLVNSRAVKYEGRSIAESDGISSLVYCKRSEVRAVGISELQSPRLLRHDNPKRGRPMNRYG